MTREGGETATLNSHSVCVCIRNTAAVRKRKVSDEANVQGGFLKIERAAVRVAMCLNYAPELPAFKTSKPTTREEAAYVAELRKMWASRLSSTTCIAW